MAVNIPAHKSGMQWNGMSFEILIDGTSQDITGCLIKATFKANLALMDEHLVLSTANNKIHITDGEAGQFKLGPLNPTDSFVINLEPGTYYYDIVIVYPGNRPIQVVEGKWEILPTATKL